jgi:Kae1-associated kinase Bud32
VYLVDLEKNRLYLERIVGRTIKDILWAGASGKSRGEPRPLSCLSLVGLLVLTRTPCTDADSEDPEEFRQRSLRTAKNVGQAVGRMHDADVVHGDLTTSNLMVREDTPTSASASASTSTSSTAPSSGDAVVVIDFGLGMMKPSLEDKAVDLYVLERAFVSTHPGSEHLVSAALEAYRFCSRKGTPTLQKLEQVRMRGRKRDMTG